MFTRSGTESPKAPFTDPFSIGPVGSPNNDYFPFVSRDGLSMYVTLHWEPGQGQKPTPEHVGHDDIYLAMRQSIDEPFGNLVHLGSEINSESWDDMGSVSADGLTLYFASGRSDNEANLLVASRETTSDDFGNVRPFASQLDSDLIENFPRVSPDGLTLTYLMGEPQPNDVDIWMATRTSPDQPFTDASRLAMNSEFAADWVPALSYDGRFLFTSDWLFQAPRPGGEGGEDIWVSYRPDPEEPFDLPINPDDLWPASELNSSARSGGVYLSPDWPADGSQIYYTSTGPGSLYSPLTDIFQATWSLASMKGDFNFDDELTIEDFKMLRHEARNGIDHRLFDLNNDGEVNEADGVEWITEVKGTWIGDANLDGEFNSGDFVEVFQAGEYDDTVEANSTWATGDWNGDREFDSGDFVTAFQGGGFEIGPRPNAISVPEPSMRAICLSILCGGYLLQCRRRRL